MALVGYARVSTTDQDHATQVERLLAAGCTKVFSEKKSGTTQKGRTALEECLSYIREGDTLVFTKIDRLARSSRDLQNLVHDLENKGVANYSPLHGHKSIFQTVNSSFQTRKAVDRTIYP